MSEIQKVEIVARKKGSKNKWEVMFLIKVYSVDEAKEKIRNRCEALAEALEFGIQVTTIEEFSESAVMTNT